MREIFPGVYKKDKQILTRNLIKGKSLTEHIIEEKGKEYRVWDPKRSKACAALVNGLKTFPVKEGSKILYLGIASGSTASYFSDIIGPEGVIYGVEMSERCVRDLNPIAEKRKNIIPILASARTPQNYSWVEPVDVIFQDVATDDQSEILIRNAKQFLKKEGYALISIKARSIDVTKEPRQVFKEEIKTLQTFFSVKQKVILDPYEKDHMLVLLTIKN